MKKILYLVSTLGHSGPTNQLSYIIKYLDKDKFDFSILTLSNEPEISAIEYFENILKVKVDSLNLSRVQGFISGRAKLNKYIYEHNIDLVHAHGIRADGLIKKTDIPQICTLRAYPYKDYYSKFGRFKGLLLVYIHMRIIKQNHQNFIACSNSISKEFLKHNLLLDYIQNGVDTNKYYPLIGTERNELKNKLKVESNKKIFITVGSLISRKNVQTIIQAFNLHNKANTSILIIAGVGPEEEKLKLISNQSVRFLGNVSNVKEYLQVSDFYVSASLAEGLPNTVLEAMACGLPVILSNIPSHKELCNDQSIFYETHDVRDLSEKLNNTKNPTFEVKNNILEVFSADVMSKKYQKIYLERAL